MTGPEIDAYLLRIGDRGPREPTPGTLTRLHRAHMRTVPFENLDIPLGVPIRLALPRLYEKIVERRRGGFCYELNGLFAGLLRALGFELELLSARVFDDDRPGPEFAHLLLLVDLGERWIADVGFGDSFVEPLPLAAAIVVRDGVEYRLRRQDADWIMDRRRRTANWEPQYTFTLTGRRLEEFEPMCRYHQTHPDSHFTGRSVCSRATARGRVTVSNGRLIVSEAQRRDERAIVDAADYRAVLERHFGIELDPAAPIDPLLAPAAGAQTDG
jgi:N-hydroxyarylamine O-acetyltransferase